MKILIKRRLALKIFIFYYSMLTLKYTYDSRNFRFFMSQKVEKPSLSGHRLKTRKRGKSTGHYIVFNNNSVKISMCNMNVALAINIYFSKQRS